MFYGWGEDHEGEFDDSKLKDEDEDGEEEKIPENAVRFTVQSRSDFYLVDEETLMKQVLRRAADLGLNLDREYLDDHGGAMGGFAELWGLEEEVHLTGMGFVRGGSQFTTCQIEETLWEMDERDFGLRGDSFPTDG